MPFVDHAKVVIAEPEVQRDAPVHSEGVLNVPGVRILERVTARITPGGSAAAQQAAKKIFERGEVEPSSIAGVKERVDESTAEFIAELEFVPGQLPREVINEVPVSVDASSRDR